MSVRNPRSVNIGLRNIVATIFILLGLMFVWEIRGTLMLTFAAVILVVLFTMPVRFLIRRFQMNRFLAILLSVIGFYVMLGLIGLPILRTLLIQFDTLARETVPQGLEEARASITRQDLVAAIPLLDGVIPENATDLINEDLINQAITQVSDAVGRLGGTVLPVVGGLANTILSALIIFFLSMYLLAEPDLYVNGIIKLTPIWYRERMVVVLRRIDATLRGWLTVTFVSMLVVAALTGLGLALLRINEWLALGVLAGLLSFIPNFGPLVALVPSVAVAIVQAQENVIWVAVVIYGVSFFQSQVVSPVLASERMNMPAILILLGQIIFGFFFGFLGLMLAVPLSACFAVLVDEMYVKDILGDVPQAEREALPEGEALAEDLQPEPT
ncbi:MAG: AI-2E family transporter [Chloroflexi bacterium]|nr:AI-2E family transporter [Chloroflexota bacterium]MCY3583620.1 AI-2E family transporter [Chloroflexota bacterium]MCY3715736.1 AI-2E family transporter [Chloroflexota bacterium]MDE2651255.1 AI-2E family transporter [Chloroflexota bacterium]MXX51150.1 AI-2E family transporter [Chloroflexota bacterium]